MKQQELDEKVMKAYATEECQKPILDGIVNEELFRSGIPKILWILKEPYGEENWSLREVLDKDPKGMFSFKTFKKITYTSYGIIHGVSYEEAKKAANNYDILKSISLINVSKCPVEQKTDSKNYGRLGKTFEKCKSVLLEQIDFIKPDIIIGGSIAYLLINHYKLEWKGGKHYLPFMKRTWLEKDGVLIIDAKHPSAIVSEEGYCNEIINTVKKWEDGIFDVPSVTEKSLKTTVSGTSFFDKWVQILNDCRADILQVWKQHTAFTSFIKSESETSILNILASAFGLKCYPKDYYSLDAIFYDDNDLVPNIPANSYWFRNISIAFEHENHFKSGLYKEISHLLITNSEVKVLVTYPDDSDEDGSKALEYFHKIISGSLQAQKLSEDESFLVIFGYENNFQWIGHIYKDTGWKTIDSLKKS